MSPAPSKGTLGSFDTQNGSQETPVEPTGADEIVTGNTAGQVNENAATLDGDWSTQDRPEDGELFYCPACGNRVTYQQKCTGKDPSSPHPACEVVDAVELWDAVYPEDARDPMTGRQYPVGALDPNELTAAPTV
jgi:hypothetical protein